MLPSDFQKYWLLWAEILDKIYTNRKTNVIWDFPENFEHFYGSSYRFDITNSKGPLNTTKIV